LRREFRTMVIVVVCGILGVVSAMIVKTMYIRGHVIDEMITGTITIGDLQFVVFLAWLLIGIMMGALQR